MADRVLVLRTVASDMTSYRGSFIYPTSGMVEAPDWDGGEDCCGGGLHGFLRGCGNESFNCWDDGVKWLVISVDPEDGLVEEVHEHGGGKCKFRRGDVVYCGDHAGAVAYLDANGCADLPVLGAARLNSAIKGTATASGYKGAATASGVNGTATASGRHGTATAGINGILSWKVWEGSRQRLHVRYVGEDGIKPDTPYRWDSDRGEAVEVVKTGDV